jgi:hypothetical protein
MTPSPDVIPVTDRYVAFMDLLGFKAEIEAAERDAALWPRIVEVLGIVKGCLSESSWVGMKLSTFSDCIIISTDRTPEALVEMWRSIVVLTSNLLQHDVLVRGGLTAGPALHDEHFVFGSVVNRAYEMECGKEWAVFPMTLVARDVQDDVARYGMDASSLFAVDGARWFVDFFQGFANHDAAIRHPGTLNLDRPATRIQQFMARRLREHRGRVCEKAEWVAAYWNRRVASVGKFGPIRADLPVVAPLPGPTIIYRAIAIAIAIANA